MEKDWGLMEKQNCVYIDYYGTNYFYVLTDNNNNGT